MKKTKFDKQLEEIYIDVFKCIEKIFDKHNEDGILMLGGGIDYDYCKSIEYDWMYTNMNLIKMDDNFNLYDEEDNEISLHDFDTSALVKFYNELRSIYD